VRVSLVGLPSMVHSLTELLHDPINRGVYTVTATDPRVTVELEPVHTQSVVLTGVRSDFSDLVLDHLVELTADPVVVDRKRKRADLTVGVPANSRPSIVETALYRAILDLRSRNGSVSSVPVKRRRRWWWPFVLLLASVQADAAPLRYALNPGADPARLHSPLLFQPAPGGLLPILVKISDGTDTALVSGTGSLQVTCDNCGAAPSFSDNSAFTFGTTGISNVGFVVDDTATNSVAENSAGAPRMSTSRVVYFNQTNQGGTVFATIRDLAANDSLNVAIVDGTGAQITSFGGGTEYTEDVATPADPIGKATMLRRRDTPTAEVTTAGDWVAANATNYGAQFCQVVTSAGAFVDSFGGSGGTAQADESAFTEGTTTFTPIGGVLNDTITSDPTEDQAAAARITAKRGIHVNLRNVAGTEVGSVTTPLVVGDGAGALNVIVDSSALPTGAATLTEQQTQTTALQLIDNLPVTQGSTTAGQSGVLVQGAVTTSAPAYTTAQTSPLSLQTDGDLRVEIEDALPAGTNNIGDVDVLTFPDNEPVNVAQVGGSAVVADPCMREARIPVSISQTAGAQLITGTASERIFICSFHVVTATAQNVALVSGTGTVCATSPSGVLGFGGSTAATGWNFAANGGIQMGHSNWSYGKTDTDADNVCLLQSGAGQVSGGLTYVSAADF